MTKHNDNPDSVPGGEALLDILPSAVFTVDSNQIVTSWNREAERLTGFSGDEVIGKPCSVFARKPCEDKCGLLDDQTQKPVHAKECTIRRKDGEERTISKNLDVMRDESGSLEGGVESFIDITHLKETEAQLEHHREDLKTLLEERTQQLEAEKSFIDVALDSLAGVFYVLDDQGCMLRWNKHFEDVIGYSAEELYGTNALEFFEGDGRQHIAERIRDVFVNGEASAEAEFVTRSGEHIPYYFTGARTLDREKTCLVGMGIDISERVDSERKAARAMNYMNCALSGAPLGIIQLDDTGTFTSVNPSFLSLVRRTESDFLGKTISQLSPPLFAPGTLKTISQRVKRRLETGEAITDAEIVVLDKEGSRIPIRYSASGIIDEEGNVLGEVVFISDIRQQIRMEANLVHSAQEWQSTFDAMPEAVFLLDNDQRILRSNRSAVTLTGKQEKEIQGKHCWSVVHGTDGPIEGCPCRKMLKSGKHETMPLEIDGRSFEVTVDPTFDDEGQRTGCVHVVSEVTRQKEAQRALEESERNLRAIFEGATDGICILDKRRMRFIVSNEEFASMTGYSREDLMKLSPMVLHPEDEAERVASLFSECSDGQSMLIDDVPMKKRDGSILYVSIRVSEISLDGVKYLLGIVRDITERRAQEENRRRLEERLRQQQKLEAVGTLAGGVAHEINNPINGIMNYAQLILDSDDTNKETKGFSKEIIHETERVATIVRNLLAFSRLDKQDHSPAIVSDIVSSTMSLIQTVLRRDQITLNIDLAGDLPMIRCRSQQIQQVLMNLVTNARDALIERYPGHHENKTISITAELVELNRRQFIRLAVRDHGAGIDEAVKEHIYEPFFTTKPKETGTGLGLAISYGIAKDHGGDLTMETEPGEWTCFRLDLPLEIDERQKIQGQD